MINATRTMLTLGRRTVQVLIKHRPKPFEISHDVDMPRQRHRPDYPLADLAVGDSFVMQPDSNVYRLAKKLGITITRRQESGAWRVWRTA